MGLFLNSRNTYENFREITQDTYFVDKSLLIQELMPAIGTKNRYFCITRPRRFGKTVIANMIGAFFGKAADSSALFDGLKIAKAKNQSDRHCHHNKDQKNPEKTLDYAAHLNQYHIIYIDFSEVPRNCTNYGQYIDRIQNGINKDLSEAYPDLQIPVNGTTWDILSEIFQKTGSRFLFIMDEWDAPFHMPYITENDQKAYLLFLKALLKDKAYTELVYMTGILPIAKYSDGSELNMFVEYNMATSERFSEYFGFLDTEVDELYAIYIKNCRKNAKEIKISREDLAVWYDGYHTAAGSRIYNPRAIVCALTDNQLRNYWTSSGTSRSKTKTMLSASKESLEKLQNI